MLVARQVFRARYGRGDDLVALFKEFNTRMQEEGEPTPRFRILTDASGPFFTVVTEVEVENFAAWEGRSASRWPGPGWASGSAAWCRWSSPGAASSTTSSNSGRNRPAAGSLLRALGARIRSSQDLLSGA